MKVEVATEAYSDLVDVVWCDKNQNHEDFQTLADFSIDDLPEDFRNEETLLYVRQLSTRVVRIGVNKANSTLYGTGVVFKFGDTFLMSTNEHVVGSEEDVNKCTIDFFYDTVDGKGREKSYGQAFLGCSELQDRSLFTFNPVPQKIKEMSMFDNTELVAYVVFRLDGVTEVKSKGYVYRNDHKWLLGVFRPQYDFTHIDGTVPFFRKTNVENPIEARFVQIDHIESKLIHIEIDNVPDFVQAASLKSCVAPWPIGNQHFTPFVIAHPHGGPKKITQGKCLAVESDGDVGKLVHTARTCPGSSGGLVITVGGDASHYLQYAADLCIHCEGERGDELCGIPVESGNINLSIFNTT